MPSPSPSSVPGLSVIIPFYNEEANLISVLAELRTLLDHLGSTYEVLAINDGSKDSTTSLLNDLIPSWPELHPIHLPTNQGQASALWAGFQACTAPLVAVLDGDGQNDPSALPSMIDHLEKTGADMVTGVRAKRQDSWLRKRMSRVANNVRQFFLKDGVSDSGCALKVMRREVISAFLPLRTLYSFMPALAVSAGFSVVEVPVVHRPRTAGTSSYGLIAMLWRPAVDMLGIWWFGQRRFRTPGRPQAPASNESISSQPWFWILPIMIFFLLGHRGLNEPDEGRYAEIAREMAVSGDWLVPHLNGFEHFQKPPLIYWATALSFKLFGFTEWAARLPSALAAWGTVILTFFLTRRKWDATRAHVACTMLISMLGLFISARLLIPDTTMAFWIIASITALSFERRGWFFVCMGLGFLTKGPMAIVVPLAAAVGRSLSGARRKNWPWVTGLLATLLISLSWFLIMAAQKPELFDYFLRYELVERFASTSHGRSRPWWFFLPVLLVALLPWTISLPKLIKKTWLQLKSRNLSPRQGLLVGWVLIPLVILSLAGSKLPTYILPLLPGLAIGLSAFWTSPRRTLTFAMPAIATWIAIIALSGPGNDSLGRQASLRNLSATLSALLHEKPAEVFVCGTRAHGLEFYLQQLVSTTRPEGDIVLPLSTQDNLRVYKNAKECLSHFASVNAYGIMRRDTFNRYFAPDHWEIITTDGDFALVSHSPSPLSN